MSKDKHEPKDSKKKFQISDDAEKTLLGLMLVVIALIGLLNKGIVGEFLTYVFVYAFGAFYFLFFFFLIFFGIYLIVKKKGLSFKVNLVFLACTLLFISALIAASLGENDLTIRTVFTTYQAQIGSISEGMFHIESLANVGITGGGFVGYFLTALLNSAVSEIGTKIIVAVFILIAFFILLRRPFIFFFGKIKKSLNERKSRKEEQKLAKQEAGYIEEDDIPVVPSKQRVVETAPEMPLGKAPIVNTSPFSIKRAPVEKKVEAPKVEPAPIAPTVEEEASSLRKEDYLVDSSEVVAPEKADTETKPQAPFFNLFRKSKTIEEVEEKEVEEEEYNKEDSDILPTLDRNERKTVSPLAKSYGTQTATNPNEYVVDNTPKKTVAPSVKRRYLLPSGGLLTDHKDYGKYEQNLASAQERTELINEVFDNFNLKASVISYTIGPSVTRYNVRTEPGVRVSALANLVNEIQVGLRGDKSVRIETVVQGKDTSGIEVGNPVAMTVPFKKCFEALQGDDKLAIPLGQGIDGQVIKISIDALPHLLIAGSTGSGKSVFVHSIIMSLIMRNYPEELKLIMIDPKKVEFTKYQNLPHLYCPIITEPDLATAALYKLVSEMERRYTLLSRNEVVNVKEYRKRCETHPDLEVLPDIVVIVDEFADLISNNAKEIEPLIQRIAQKARAAGIYLIIATQRPSVNVITGDIKANIPARIALSVSSAIDSRTILDEMGAETLLGKGDLLARIPGVKFLSRVQSAYVSADEISKVVAYLKEQEQPQYNPDFLNLELREDENGNLAPANRQAGGKKGFDDEYYETIKTYVLETQTASTSSIMRHYGLGYGRAASILDSLEEEGIIKTIGNGRKTVLRKLSDED